MATTLPQIADVLLDDIDAMYMAAQVLAANLTDEGERSHEVASARQVLRERYAAAADMRADVIRAARDAGRASQPRIPAAAVAK